VREPVWMSRPKMKATPIGMQDASRRMSGAEGLKQ
jgi:hypothetical protein